MAALFQELIMKIKKLSTYIPRLKTSEQPESPVHSVHPHMSVPRTALLPYLAVDIAKLPLNLFKKGAEHIVYVNHTNWDGLYTRNHESFHAVAQALKIIVKSFIYSQQTRGKFRPARQGRESAHQELAATCGAQR